MRVIVNEGGILGCDADAAEHRTHAPQGALWPQQGKRFRARGERERPNGVAITRFCTILSP